MAKSGVEAFLTAREEQEIILAILEAEMDTSGEIRVHLESSAQTDHYTRAQEIFHVLKMDNTRQRNGVLIYIAVADHKFVIYGDKGIDDVVPDDFWNSTRDAMANYFMKGSYKDGIIAGIQSTGQELKTHFPWNADDRNELPDAITKS
ncbi:MAG: TPM domain-containing protein [Bacteroidia bacterium]|nr:TPM domain-containing protein [Bacteroidia bacterium]